MSQVPGDFCATLEGRQEERDSSGPLKPNPPSCQDGWGSLMTAFDFSKLKRGEHFLRLM